MRTVLAVLLLAATASADALDFSNAWIREAPPSATVLAGYVEIANGGKSEVQLTAADSEAFDEVEFHEMSMTDGVMKMRGVDALVVPAGGSISLQPGGVHLMLVGPKGAPKAGEKVHVVFEDADGKRSTVSFEVRKSAQ